MHPSSFLPRGSQGAHNVMDGTVYCQNMLHGFFCPRQPGDTLFPRLSRWSRCTCAHKTPPHGGTFWISPGCPIVKGSKGRRTTPPLPAAEVFPYGCCTRSARASNPAPMEALLQLSQTGSIAGSQSKVGVSTPLQPQSQDLEAKLPDVASPASPRAMLPPLVCCEQKLLFLWCT